ncbi:MAG: hypothetical protein ACI358_09430 [Candidatus Limimorpha sp.]
MKNLNKALFLLTVIIMLTVMVQTVFHVFNLKKLSGARVEPKKPTFTFEAYLDGSLQKDVEQYSKENFGFYEWLIKIYNQYLWTCYHKTNNNNLVFGKSNWIFEQEIVREHYESLMYEHANDSADMMRKLDLEAKRLWKAQEILKEYDKYIFVNMLPCKDVIYPEYLPENTYSRPEGIHAYEYYKKKFDELNINYIDNVELLKAKKDIVDYPIFVSYGSHWTNIASIYQFDTILKYMEHLGDKNLNNIVIGEKYVDKTRVPDNDLEELLNLVFPLKSEPNYYVDVTTENDNNAIKPYCIVVGDSYFWNIIYNIPLNEIFCETPYWYYNNTVYNQPPIVPTKLKSLTNEISSATYIILNYCTTKIYELGNFFISKLLVSLCYNDEQVNKVVEDISNVIVNDEKWLKYVSRKAVEDNVTLEQAIENDARYLIMVEPEKYFPELAGDDIPSVRNSDLSPSSEKIIFETKRKNYIYKIYSDESWMNNIKMKAEVNGISFEEQMERDIIWMIQNN